MNTSIERNSIVKTLAKQVFGKKSPNAGKEFYAPVVDVDVADDLKWAGADTLNGLINKGLRSIFADIYLDNLDKTTGLLNEAAWEADAADFTAGVAKLSDLEEQIDNLQALQQSYTVDNDEFGATDETGALTPEAKRLSDLVRENNGKIKALRAQKQVIEAKYAERAAKRAAKQAAAPAVATA